MTQFEQMLLDKGYIKYILNCKTMKFEIPKRHTISTMVNLDHRYFHNTDTNILQKIESSKSVMEEDFTWEDRKGEICFGLSEAGKPPTLISPRPQIKIKRIKEGKQVIENEQLDDSMNLVLQIIPHEEIFKAMYDKSICFEIDLTLNN
jgi:hypothetical protein